MQFVVVKAFGASQSYILDNGTGIWMLKMRAENWDNVVKKKKSEDQHLTLLISVSFHSVLYKSLVNPYHTTVQCSVSQTGKIQQKRFISSELTVKKK